MLVYRVTRVGVGSENIESYMKAVSAFLTKVEASSTPCILEEVNLDNNFKEKSSRVVMSCTVDDRGNKIINKLGGNIYKCAY